MGSDKNERADDLAYTLFLTLSSQRKVLQRQQSGKRNWNSIGKILREEGKGAVKRQKFLGTLPLDGPRFTVSGKYLDFK